MTLDTNSADETADETAQRYWRAKLEETVRIVAMSSGLDEADCAEVFATLADEVFGMAADNAETPPA